METQSIYQKDLEFKNGKINDLEDKIADISTQL